MKKLSFNLLMDSTIFSTNCYPFSGIEVSPIQFLPVVMLQLFKRDGQPTSMIYNVEPYMQGNFTRLTNNWDFVNTNGVGCKLVLAFRFVKDNSNDFSHKFHFWLNLYFDLTYLLNKPIYWTNLLFDQIIFWPKSILCQNKENSSLLYSVNFSTNYFYLLYVYNIKITIRKIVQGR